MKTICAWCGKLLKPGDGPTSHGICPECFKSQTDEIIRFTSKDLPTASPGDNSGAGPSIANLVRW